MPSAVNAISLMRNIALANNASDNMMSIANARQGMLVSPMMFNPSFGSLKAISQLETQQELSMIQNSLQYKMALAMSEQLKKQQKEEAKKFSYFV